MRPLPFLIICSVCLSVCSCKKSSSHSDVSGSQSEQQSAVKVEGSQTDDAPEAVYKTKMPDFELPDRAGNTVSLLADIGKNKFTIIDFWASWCGPCMREVTFLKEAYRRYKDRGVDIVSVSLDTDGDRWRSAIVDWEMPWKHVSDLQGWKTAPVVKLGIEGIPFIVVVDSEGYVVESGLRGMELIDFLEKRLGK